MECLLLGPARHSLWPGQLKHSPAGNRSADEAGSLGTVIIETSSPWTHFFLLHSYNQYWIVSIRSGIACSNGIRNGFSPDFVICSVDCSRLRTPDHLVNPIAGRSRRHPARFPELATETSFLPLIHSLITSRQRTHQIPESDSHQRIFCNFFHSFTFSHSFSLLNSGTPSRLSNSLACVGILLRILI